MVFFNEIVNGQWYHYTRWNSDNFPKKSGSVRVFKFKDLYARNNHPRLDPSPYGFDRGDRGLYYIKCSSCDDTEDIIFRIENIGVDIGLIQRLDDMNNCDDSELNDGSDEKKDCKFRIYLGADPHTEVQPQILDPIETNNYYDELYKPKRRKQLLKYFRKKEKKQTRRRSRSNPSGGSRKNKRKCHKKTNRYKGSHRVTKVSYFDKYS
jgi:hypothetical protein